MIMPLESSIDITTARLEEISTGRRVKMGEIKDRLKAFCIFALTGNDLYLRFPKKLRRRRR